MQILTSGFTVSFSDVKIKIRNFRDCNFITKTGSSHYILLNKNALFLPELQKILRKKKKKKLQIQRST